MPGVIRAKGHFWIATRPEWLAEFSLAGALSSISPLGTWWASVPSERWPNNPALRDYLQANWEDPWGDRRQELVFIGAGVDWIDLESRLNSALLPEHFNPEGADLTDPFPIWRKQDVANP